MGRKVLRSSFEPSNWSDHFGSLGAEAKKGEERTGKQRNGWRLTGPRIQGFGMKLLPSWRAVLPVGPVGLAWPWAQQTRSRWALEGLGLGQHCGEQNLGPRQHQLRSLSPSAPRNLDKDKLGLGLGAA